MLDSGDLSSEKLGFGTVEEGIGDDLAGKITSEQNTDVPGSSDLSWCKVWKLGPGGEGIRGDIEDGFVNACTWCFLAFLAGSFWVLLNSCFDDIVVSLGASDLAEECQHGGL